MQWLARRPRVDAQPAQLFPPQMSFQMWQRRKGARAREKLTQGARVCQQGMCLCVRRLNPYGFINFKFS